MRQRGAIVYRDLRPSGFPLSFWIVGSFLTGIAALILSLEFSITMEDRRVLDPPLQPTESSSDDDFYGGPPTPWGGVVLHFLVNLTLKQMVAQVFHLDVDTPGLVRILCNSTPVDLRTTVDGLDWPRRVFVQISSYTEYQRSFGIFHHLQHAPVATPHEHHAQGTRPVQVYLHFVSVFRALQQYENLISSQSVVIGRLEARLARLERAVSTGEPIVLTPRQPTELSVWYPDSPRQSEPAAASENAD